MRSLSVKHTVTEVFQSPIVAFEVEGTEVKAILSYTCPTCAGYGDQRGGPCPECGGDGRKKEEHTRLADLRSRIGDDEYERVHALLKKKL